MSILSKLKAIRSWKNTDCVCLDVDSTVCRNEGIDDLANYIGVGAQVKQLTLNAMDGNMTFREALKKRLSIIRPSFSVIERFNKIQHDQLTPHVKELIDTLHSKSIPVYLISGGFRLVIDPIASILNIDYANVFANTILFDKYGEYEGFDHSEYTSESGGKARVIEMLKQQYGYQSVVMIGDGATDLETCPPADAFIGFGGNVVRDVVRDNSDWFVYSFKELIDQL